MISRIYAIARNTLFETIRQPVFLVVLMGALAMIAFSPAFTMFTLVNHIKLVTDMGLATIMVTGMLLSVVAASTVISEEIRKKTVLTVVSKPVDRFEFVLGKYAGIIVSIVIAGYLMVLVLTMTVRIGVPATASTKLDFGPIVGMLLSTGLAMFGAILANYFFDRPFPSTAICLALVVFSLAFGVVGFLPPVSEALKERFLHYNWSVMLAGILVMLAVSVIATVAVAVSTRLNPLFTFGICAAFFVFGLVVEELLRKYSEAPFLFTFPLRAFFNIQYFFLADALSSERVIPFNYIIRASFYAATYQAAILCGALYLFQDREVAR
ncbi:MAG: hypothetical protein QF437_15585 [Planctomycetota bacterium]|jgi:hypothetical protein|nr:hypothetical protein [Planctomycetota bacterium]MDP7131918.1 hypothetical protein [Planctomycetota bacterium]MDP7253588.1 hypothetical protein [Planctomycetota bacterium]